MCTEYWLPVSLPRKSVVRLTDRPNMTLAVDRGLSATTQHQQQQHIFRRQKHTENIFWSLFWNKITVRKVHFVSKRCLPLDKWGLTLKVLPVHLKIILVDCILFQIEITLDNILEIITNTSYLTVPEINLTEADISYVADILYNLQLFGIIDVVVRNQISYSHLQIVPLDC